MFSRVCLLLCPADSRIPRARRRDGLRAQDHGQAASAAAASGGVRAPFLERRAGRLLRRHRLLPEAAAALADRKSTRLNSSHVAISYAVFCLKKKKTIMASPT